MQISWKNCFKIGVSIFLLYLCITYWSAVAGVVSSIIGASMPLIAGCVLAYFINILMKFYEKHYFPKSKKNAVRKSRRAVCMSAAIISLIAVVALVFIIVVPQLSSCIQLIFAELPDAFKTAVTWLDNTNLLPDSMADTLSTIDWQSKIGQIANVVISGIGSVTDILVSTVSSVFSAIATAIIAIIFAIYLLMGKDTLKRQFNRIMKRYMKPALYDRVTHTLSVINKCFRRFIVGQCTEALILGLLCTIGLLILRMPYATMIGALIAFTSLIPIAGALIGAAVGAFMILTVSPIKALIFIIFIVVLQQIEGNVIYPKVVGTSLGLPSIWVLAAVTIGGGLMGILGMLLGVPLAAAAYKLFRENLNKA